MNQKAFTLIELIMVITLIGITALMLAPFISTCLDAWLFSESERDVVFSSRLAMNRMVREIRQVFRASSINTFTATEFEFVDVDSNTINFQQSGSSLNRDSNELAQNLQNPDGLTFTYLDSDGNVTATQADIRMVRIKLIIESGDSSITLQSLARFRNT